MFTLTRWISLLNLTYSYKLLRGFAAFLTIRPFLYSYHGSVLKVWRNLLILMVDSNHWTDATNSWQKDRNRAPNFNSDFSAEKLRSHQMSQFLIESTTAIANFFRTFERLDPYWVRPIVCLSIILAPNQFCKILNSLSLQIFMVEVAYIYFVLI